MHTCRLVWLSLFLASWMVCSRVPLYVSVCVRMYCEQTRDKRTQLCERKVCDALAVNTISYLFLFFCTFHQYHNNRGNSSSSSSSSTHTHIWSLYTQIVLCVVVHAFYGFFYDFIASELLVFHALCSWLVARNKTIYRFGCLYTYIYIYLVTYIVTTELTIPIVFFLFCLCPSSLVINLNFVRSYL